MRTISLDVPHTPPILIASHNHDTACPECGQAVIQGQHYVVTALGRVHLRCWPGSSALTLSQLLSLLQWVYRRS